MGRPRPTTDQQFANIYFTSRAPPLSLLLLFRRRRRQYYNNRSVREIMRIRPPAVRQQPRSPHCIAYPPNGRFADTAVAVTLPKTRGMFGLLVLHVLSAAALLCDRCGCAGQTAEVSTLTSQVGGYAIFECPVEPQPRFDHDGGPRRLAAVRWTKDVSAPIFLLRYNNQSYVP